MFAAFAFAQEEGEEPSVPGARASQTVQDALLPRLRTALERVTTPDVAALSRTLRIGQGLQGSALGAPGNTLTPLGDLDGDGVPELLLKWAAPDVLEGEYVPPAADSSPLWRLYFLSWDGSRWKVSPLVMDIEDFSAVVINLGPLSGRGVALVVEVDEAQFAYPTIFQIKDHAAIMLWDGQADDSRYEPLEQGRVEFVDHPNAPAEMIVTGRADPGLLQFKPRGQRGFKQRTLYQWDGQAFVPRKNECSANQDYTVYRFIAALHLHDYRSAYELVAPAKFLKADSPTLDAFRQFIENNWSEFLQDEVFEAPEPPAGSPDVNYFVLTKPGMRYVYHPEFSSDGKFMLTGLTRTQEALPGDPPAP
jgi:hypothetical protein